MLLWLLMTWLIKGVLSKFSSVLSEISGVLLDLEHLWLTNQIVWSNYRLETSANGIYENPSGIIPCYPTRNYRRCANVL